jgi:hypothetical protein
LRLEHRPAHVLTLFWLLRDLHTASL